MLLADHMFFFPPVQLCPEDAEDYIEFLLQLDRLDEAAEKCGKNKTTKKFKLDEAAVKLAEIINCDNFVSKYGKPKHQVLKKKKDLFKSTVKF